jgi:DNA integrity scanning protein DisA with diadenylate cyclase activity
MEMTKAKLADLLEGFVSDTCGKGEWDAFVSVRQKDAEIENIRLRCEMLDVEFPPRKPYEYCNDDGAAVLMNYVRQLRGESGS